MHYTEYKSKCQGSLSKTSLLTDLNKHSISQGAEEGAYVLDQRLWLLQCCEVSSRLHLRPTLDIIEALGKGTWWCRDLILENSHTCRYLNPPSQYLITLMIGLVVEARRRVNGLR